METTDVRLALTISGAVSLGAFEGGVLAALITAVRAMNDVEGPTVRIDAIGGASAGAMTALVTARCLTTRIDPVAAMQLAWVSGDSIQHLLHTVGDSPLSPVVLQELAAKLFSDEVPGAREHTDASVRLVLTLCCLRGLEYTATQPGRDGVGATTYVDLATFAVDGTWSAANYLTPPHAGAAAVAIASGANEFGFPPQFLDRRAEREDYARLGLGLPDSEGLWYSDGGTLDNEPLGHTLDLTNELDKECPEGTQRTHLMIHPNVDGGPTGLEWANEQDAPTWVATLRRASHLQRTQSLYDDLRAVTKTNTRIGWLRDVVDGVKGFVSELPAEEQERLRQVLSASMARIGEEKAALPGSHAQSGAAATDAAELFDQAVGAATGLGDKRSVGLDVISPLALSRERNVPISRMLAGEVLGHFGGFFDENMRRSDFNLGYQCAVKWMHDGGLDRCGTSAAQVAAAVGAASAAYQPEELWKKLGDTGLADVALHHPVALAGLVGQVARVTMRDALHLHHGGHPTITTP